MKEREGSKRWAVGRPGRERSKHDETQFSIGGVPPSE